MKRKAFFIIFKGLLLKQIKQAFLEGETMTLKEHSWKFEIDKLTYSKRSVEQRIILPK